MKYLLCTFVSIISSSLLLSQSGNGNELAEAGYKRLPLKSGKISYAIGGEAIGTASYVFDQFGWIEQTQKSIQYKLYGISTSKESLEGRDGEFYYTVDLSTKTGEKSKDKSEVDLIKYKTVEEVKEAIYLTRGGEKKGIKEILGKNATVWKFEQGNQPIIWEWNGIILYQEIKIGKIRYTMTATNYQENIPIEILMPSGISW